MKTLNKIIIFIMLIIMVSFSPAQSVVFAQSLSDNSAIILSGEILPDKEIKVTAKLAINTGISAMILEIDYNSDVMVLTNIEQGDALASLDYLTTNTDTQKGYSYRPFKISYDGEENDFSTGVMFVMHFKLFNQVKDGKYNITLKYSRNRDVNYIAEDKTLKTKNLSIDQVQLTIENNDTVGIKTVEDSNKISIFPILVIVASVITVSAIVIFTISFNKRKGWKKI